MASAGAPPPAGASSSARWTASGCTSLTLDEAGRGRPATPRSSSAAQYGRLRTVVLDAEGGLWITTSNRDGIGTPAEDDDKVLRILPPSTAGNSPL